MPSRGASGRTGRHAGFSIVEMAFALFVLSSLMGMFGAVYLTWGRIRKQTTVQHELQISGRIALEKVMRSLRQDMLGLVTINYTNADFANGLVVLADADHDGTPDSLKGWATRAMDANADGAQDRVDTDDDGIREARLWELLEIASSSTNIAAATWRTQTLCGNLVSPWVTPDHQHSYSPFEFTGSDPVLDLGLDGTPNTGDTGEGDGVISEVELGNYINGNGVIDHRGEISKVTAIGVGLKLLKRSVLGENESVIIFQGRIKPRNWNREA